MISLNRLIEICKRKMLRFHMLAAAAPEEVSDSAVERALMKVVITKSEDINVIVAVLERSRPELLKKLNDRLAKQRSDTH